MLKYLIGLPVREALLISHSPPTLTYKKTAIESFENRLK